MVNLLTEDGQLQLYSPLYPKYSHSEEIYAQDVTNAALLTRNIYLVLLPSRYCRLPNATIFARFTSTFKFSVVRIDLTFRFAFLCSNLFNQETYINIKYNLYNEYGAS